MKYLALCLALLGLSSCYVTVDEPNPPHPYQEYDCLTYSYCDGFEEYEQFDVCTSQLGAIEVEDDFLYDCDLYGYNNCYHYECSADCQDTGFSCR